MDIQDYFILVADGIIYLKRLIQLLDLTFMGVPITLNKLFGFTVVMTVLRTLIYPHDEFEDF